MSIRGRFVSGVQRLTYNRPHTTWHSHGVGEQVHPHAGEETAGAAAEGGDAGTAVAGDGDANALPESARMATTTAELKRMMCNVENVRAVVVRTVVRVSVGSGDAAEDHCYPSFYRQRVRVSQALVQG